MAVDRQVREGTQKQGEDERLVYSLTTTPWGSSPSDPVVTVKDVTSGTAVDVTSTTTTGTASVAGDVISLPILHSLMPNHTYRVEVQFTTNGNTWECYFLVVGEV